MVRRPPLRDEDRAEWDFSDLLRWHLERGTRPEASPRQPGRPWPIKVFADSLGVNDRTVRNWIWGRFLPSSLAPIERSLFGQNFDYTEWSRELREAFSRGNRDLESEVDEFRRRRLLGSEARLSIEDFQTYIADTPLIAPYALVSYSIFLGGHSNQIRPLDDLLTGGALGDFRAQTAEDFDDLLSHLVGDAPSSLQAELKVSVLRAIDTQWAVLYSGSVNPANSAQLSKLPTLIKGFASLSKRQFRVGLFRLATTVIIISVSGGMAAYTGWAAAKKIHEVASDVIQKLGHRTTP